MAVGAGGRRPGNTRQGQSGTWRAAVLGPGALIHCEFARPSSSGELHFISALRPVVGNAEPRLAHSLKIFPFLRTFGRGDQYCVFLCRGQGLFDLGRFAQTTTAMARQVALMKYHVRFLPRRASV